MNKCASSFAIRELNPLQRATTSTATKCSMAKCRLLEHIKE
jgi:hypothetical protein